MNDHQRTELDTITHEILTSYATNEDTQRIGEAFLPSREKIVYILIKIRQLLFPGFFGKKELTQENIKFHVGDLLATLVDLLGEQIMHCLVYADGDEGEPCSRKSAKMAREFLAEIPTIRRLLAMDAQAAYDGDPAAKNVAEVIYSYPGYFAVVVYRIAHELLRLGVPLMPRIMTEHAHSVTGTDIHPGAEIGESFFIDHATGVVIGETTELGDNVKIYQGVTLGARSFPKDESGRIKKSLKRHPTIGNNVTIYANATILGGHTVIEDGVVVGGNATVFGSHLVIGAGAKIGSNTFVNKSVAPGSTVVANPPAQKTQLGSDGEK